ncbi:DUF3293 domain-containing protein [Shewanella sp. AS1]|uniref:DUF3293 domain-containing protein n=1 Tax=Shewanella sp. AS1 TaxID=2907626 RepID=UPI001F2E7D1B|nr:DUF3293 domain-containing protein [Shewanella sp. AS1]MCE9679355.1 DUF3293 domain-containing protein [Shewanella sp. AS1]
MCTVTDHLWHCYQQTQFLLTQTFSSSLSFAIITAHNPRGQSLTASQNRLLDKQLQQHIIRLQRPYRALIGSSVDRTYMEKSWAIPIDKASAIELARQFNQNAIYYIHKGELQLVPCLLPYGEVDLGDFSARVSIVSELPDFYS